jgi:hypothetical protein
MLVLQPMLMPPPLQMPVQRQHPMLMPLQPLKPIPRQIPSTSVCTR